MKRISITYLFSIISLASHLAMAQAYRVQKVKTLGVMQTGVIYQGTQLYTDKGTDFLTGIMVLKWGVHVYEVVKAYYACDSNLDCKFTQYDRLASFEKCEVIHKQDLAVCWVRLFGDTSTTAPDVVIDDRPDAVDDSYYVDSYKTYRYDDRYPEFPARIGGEFDDIAF